ncbi:MAG TPA: ATP-binding protein [Candidatus Acidoferrales bacterium]|nr:ATP-binding protein [Candidatus Acidoferrales bacterium]
MRLRTRLAALFLVLLLVPILSMSLIALDYIVSMMIEDLSHSADLMVEQIFEGMRLALVQGKGGVNDVLKKSDSLAKLLDSTQAFGPAVVSAAILAPDGTVIVSAHGEAEGKPEPAMPPVSELEALTSRWWLFASIPRLLTADVYAARREVSIDNKPVAVISVGVTTALIGDRARHLLLVMLMTAALVTAVAWLAISLVANRILRQLAELSQGLEQLAAGGSPAEVQVAGQDELSTLAEKFNELSRQVRSDRARLDSGKTHLFDVVRSIQDAVTLLDAQGVVLFANKAARDKLAPDASAIEGAPLASILGREHPLLPLVQTTLETGTEAHDVPVELPSGGTFLVSFFRMGQERKPAGLLIVLRDLEPVIELETALDSSTQLARLGTLISGMAHQLRSPLHGMNLRLELLRESRGEGVDRHVDKLRQDVDRLDSAIEAILRFMRPADLKLADFNVNELLTELGARIKDDRISIQSHLAPDLTPVRADRAMISEALANVITNAVQAMPQGGTLTLASKPNGASVEVEIADDGVGIPKEKLERIFDLYYTTKPGGSGLGLPFAMRAIELNRGKIEFKSEPGRGTVCTIALPIAADAPAPPPAASPG